VLVVWEQGGSVFAHMLRQSGRPDPTQRLGPSAPRPLLQALVSDNDHGMAAWSTTSGARQRTRIYLDLSGAGVAFGPARRLVSFADPARAGSRPGSLSLIRLSTENVLMAWTDLEAGHYVVRSAPAVFAATRPTRRLSDPAGQSVLAGLAPGAAGEAVAVWSGTAAASADPRAGLPALWAARMAIAPHSRVVARRPALLAEPGTGATASVAVDPASDRPLVAWLVPASGTIEYASGSAPASYRQRAPIGSAPPPATGTGTHWVLIVAAAAGGAALLLAGLLLWRRRAQRAGGALASSRERRL
jgi:LPXTG-motif cell wall-anchored protein